MTNLKQRCREPLVDKKLATSITLCTVLAEANRSGSGDVAHLSRQDAILELQGSMAVEKAPIILPSQSLGADLHDIAISL